jgi:hypothetical protein
MEQESFLRINRSSATQEIPRILWDPRIHYRVYKSLLHVPVLSQIDPVHAATPPPPPPPLPISQFSKIRFNFIRILYLFPTA